MKTKSKVLLISLMASLLLLFQNCGKTSFEGDGSFKSNDFSDSALIDDSLLPEDIPEDNNLLEPRAPASVSPSPSASEFGLCELASLDNKSRYFGRFKSYTKVGVGSVNNLV